MRTTLSSTEHIPDLRVVIAINRTANRLNRRAAAIFRKHGLSTMQFAVLEVLYHKGDLTIGEIIEKILSTGGNMTVILSNLAKEGLVMKLQSPEDLRVTVISLSEAGEMKMKEVFPEYLQDLQQALMTVPEEEKNLIAHTLKRWELC